MADVRKCDHTGIGLPGCTTCDPRTGPRAGASNREAPPVSVGALVAEWEETAAGADPSLLSTMHARRIVQQLRALELVLRENVRDARVAELEREAGAREERIAELVRSRMGLERELSDIYRAVKDDEDWKKRAEAAERELAAMQTQHKALLARLAELAKQAIGHAGRADDCGKLARAIIGAEGKRDADAGI